MRILDIELFSVCAQKGRLSMPETRWTSPIDARLKVVAVALEPAFRLAHLMALPLADLQALVATDRLAASDGLFFGSARLRNAGPTS